MGSKVQISPFLISNALSPSTILLHLRGCTREEVLREMVRCFPCARDELREQLFAAILAREALCSTAIDGGIAIPHSRQAIPGIVERPVIVLGRHLQGVDFGAPDKLPTRLFFLLCADGIKRHLQMLARLSRLLRSSSLREELLAAESPIQVLTRVRTEEARMS